jgi:hypothetical protein
VCAKQQSNPQQLASSHFEPTTSSPQQQDNCRNTTTTTTTNTTNTPYSSKQLNNCDRVGTSFPTQTNDFNSGMAAVSSIVPPSGDVTKLHGKSQKTDARRLQVRLR